MKQLKLSLMMFALAIGIFSAFAFKSKAPKFDDPTYDWTGSGTAHSGALNNKTVTFATGYYGCPVGLNTCATGTLDQGTGPATATILKQ
jgi:hypothetical protein